MDPLYLNYKWNIIGDVSCETYRKISSRLFLALPCVQVFTPQPKLGSRGIVVACRAGGRAGVTSHRYRSPGSSSDRIAVKLGGDDSWGRISDDFVHGRRGSLIKRLMS